MKLLFASIATGILINGGIFITVLFVRALFKDDYSVMFLLWFFGWPICFMRPVPGLSDHGMLWFSLGIGMLLDIVFISLATYCLLRAIVSRLKRDSIAIPPQPPTL